MREREGYRGWGCVSTSVITCPHVHVSMIGLDVSVGMHSLTLGLDLCGLAGMASGQEGPSQLEVQVEAEVEGELQGPEAPVSYYGPCCLDTQDLSPHKLYCTSWHTTPRY
jgi:hypothetical protein